MPNASFPKFRKRFKKEITKRYPFIKQTIKEDGLNLPVSNTWYMHKNDLFYIINLQSSSKSWEAGCFTINIYICEYLNNYYMAPPFPQPIDLNKPAQYRLGFILDGSNSWWCLNEGRAYGNHVWESDKSSDEETNVTNCLEDVLQKIQEFFLKLNITPVNEFSLSKK